ncbi:MAG TPA: type II toxin-antitoxin system VapC family toxin [Planctomycetota bacterium]|jgi:predicted nucleic acid-binding protein|nr:type II toxin-antitoxin system VapC family toxin [Planctomycetota bacterium]
MNAYVDASVVLRFVLGQRNRLAEWEEIESLVVSPLVQVECLRTLDRARLREGVPPEEVAARREAVFRLLEEAQIVDVTKALLDRASQPLATPLGTLDAIHLATAQAWREAADPGLVLATHDAALALAGRSSGLRVIGVGPTKSTGPDTLRLRERVSRLQSVRGPTAESLPRRRPGTRRRGAPRKAKPPARAGL